LFKSYLQAVTVGWAYVEEHNGWRYVPGGKEGAMARLQQALAATQNWPYQERPTQERPTFAGGVMYSDIAQGLKDMWSASGVFKGEGRRENLGVFTPQGLLVLPNTKNTRNNCTGSLYFFALKFVDGRPQINWKTGGIDNWLPILGVVHTHPDPSGYQQHAKYWESPGDWLWTKAGLSHFIISTSGIYEGTYNGSDYISTFLGPRNDKTYQVVANKYGNQ
jgi:hypothetical protein